jgi:hypothetical protein
LDDIGEVVKSKAEYTEGPDAKEKFDGAMKTIFRAPKKIRVGQAKPAAKPRKQRASGKDG